MSKRKVFIIISALIITASLLVGCSKSQTGTGTSTANNVVQGSNKLGREQNNINGSKFISAGDYIYAGAQDKILRYDGKGKIPTLTDIEGVTSLEGKNIGEKFVNGDFGLISYLNVVGNNLYFSTGQSIWKASLKDGKAVKILDKTRYGSYMTIYKDSMYFEDTVENDGKINSIYYRVDLDGKNEEKLFEVTYTITDPFIDIENNKIYYTDIIESGNTIYYSYDLKTKKSTEISKEGDIDCKATYSNGFAYFFDYEKLMKLDMKTGEKSLIYTHSSIPYNLQLYKNRLYFDFDDDKDDRRKVSSVDLDGKDYKIINNNDDNNHFGDFYFVQNTLVCADFSGPIKETLVPIGNK